MYGSVGWWIPDVAPRNRLYQAGMIDRARNVAHGIGFLSPYMGKFVKCVAG